MSFYSIDVLMSKEWSRYNTYAYEYSTYKRNWLFQQVLQYRIRIEKKDSTPRLLVENFVDSYLFTDVSHLFPESDLHKLYSYLTKKEQHEKKQVMDEKVSKAEEAMKKICKGG